MDVFVFGSNLAGRHGKGAALEAKQWWGAEYGVGEGPTGQSYALPTKDKDLKIRSLSEIELSIDHFINYATGNPKHRFFLTPVGTGLAGYTKKEIAEIFRRKKIPDNVYLTKHWLEP